MSAVRARHEAMQNIERSMIELAQLFQDLDEIVVQQEAVVQKIDEQGMEVKDNVEQANTQINTAIDSARARNRKKWWCVVICSKSSIDTRSGVLAFAPSFRVLLFVTVC